MFNAYGERISQRRRYAVVFSVAAVTLIGIPIVQNFREKPDDGFPLSYYPMFSKERHGVTELSHPIGIREDGMTIDLHYRTVASGGMNQVRRQIRKIIRNGDAKELCRDVAENVAKSRRKEYRDIVAVAIVTDTYDFHDFFSGNRTPRRRKVIARCAVERDDHGKTDKKAKE